MDGTGEKVTIKQLLFSKPIPNYVIPVPTAGYKIYPCVDCGDKYLFQSSYEYHINRKSMQINFTCRFCNFVTHTFYNRCNMMAHIRNHAFKTATINLSDLKVQPLPLDFFKIDQTTTSLVQGVATTSVNTQNSDLRNAPDPNMKESTEPMVCNECNEYVISDVKDRVKHFTGLSKSIYTCPLCVFVLPTLCAFKSHIRIHVRSPPYFCPDCGISLRSKNLYYPYNHDCESFKMMRVNARVKCPMSRCNPYHPSEHKEHMETCHIKKVYKCSVCVVASFSKPIIDKHITTHDVNYGSLLFYQCELCPGRLVMQYQYKNHIKGHLTNQVYPCRSCRSIFKEVPTLLQHYCTKHATKTVAEFLMKILNKSEEMYYVIKRCEKCNRSFRYKCKYSDINNLPTDCPYNCFKTQDEEAASKTDTKQNSTLICHLCKGSMPDNWSDIKSHYASEHKSFKCLDLKLNIPRANIAVPKLKLKRVQGSKLLLQKQLKKKIRRRVCKNSIAIKKTVAKNTIKVIDSSKHKCTICKEECTDKALLQEHLIVHRDPYMAYQCMECGKCFAVKPSFSTHLLLEHQISNSDTYIGEKNCYNKDALIKNDLNPSTSNESVRENQCNICMDQFDNTDDLEKHFRVHGMAFLIKNKSKSP